MVITPKTGNPELQFLHSAYHLMLVIICEQFHEDVLKQFLGFGLRSSHDVVTDGQTNNQSENNMSPKPKEGRHNKHKPCATDSTHLLYSKTCVKRPLKNRQNKDLNDKW